MNDQYKVYYVAEFPIERITDRGEEGWYKQPQHLRHQYDFLGAILEHIDNTFCEPVQITMRTDGTVAVGPSGVTRLYALATLRDWQTIPAIVSTNTTPKWLDTTIPVTTNEQFASFYRLEPAELGFTTDGRAYHRNHNPNPQQVVATMEVRPATRARIVTMLEEEAKR
jgi:hypothetical protein